MEYLEKIIKESLKEIFDQKDLLKEDYLIASDDKIKMYYAPFDYINLNASVIIVGITPGWTQMEKSYRTVINEIHKGNSFNEAIKKVKSESSFAGTMRINLIKMLDEIGLNTKLNINSTTELFDSNNELLHSTSAIRYPVFKNGKNYTGSSPLPFKNKILWTQINNFLVPELNKFEGKLIVPLGKRIDEIFDNLKGEDFMNNNYILDGFPHPSGGNGHRVRLFNENKERMTTMIIEWKNKS